MAASWTFTHADQIIVGVWTIGHAGGPTGSCTSGCSYTGTVTPVAAAASTTLLQ